MTMAACGRQVRISNLFEKHYTQVAGEATDRHGTLEKKALSQMFQDGLRIGIGQQPALAVVDHFDGGLCIDLV